MAAAPHKPDVAPLQAEIGAWLQEARKAAGFTQQAVAVALGRDKQTISDWETARFRMTAEDLLACVVLYRADILELLSRKTRGGASGGGGGAAAGQKRRLG